MTNVVTVSVGVVGETPLPSCHLGGTERDIPVITWQGSDQTTQVEIALGNHPDPATYLAELAHRLAVFGEEVAAS